MTPVDLGELSPVVLYLQGPKEKVWGILLSIGPAGVVVRGIDLLAFDDWMPAAMSPPWAWSRCSIPCTGSSASRRTRRWAR